MSNFDTFVQTYREELTRVATARPDEYPWIKDTTVADVSERVNIVVGRMAHAFRTGSYNKEGHAIRATCKRLGIKPTYGAINAYLKG